jgi:dihydrodipicolinate synthase/N-acetylneuraminate lyase
VLHYLKLCERAVAGCARSRAFARELEQALQVLSTFDEGPDLVLYYKHLLVLLGDSDYEHQFNETDKLSESQRKYVEAQLKVFQNWWADWEGKG